MSVIVKGMKMPCMCSECDFCSGLYIPSDKYICECPTNKEMDISRAIDEDCRHPDCPLVEAPDKHGRLIDGDELFKQMNTAIAMISGMMKAIGAENDEGMQMELKAYRDIRDGIKDYPTVIEAEGE